jgi:hypothetical protein
MEKWKENLDFVPLGKKPEISVNHMGGAILLRDAFRKDKAYVTECHEEGSVKVGANKEIEKELLAFNGRLVYKYVGEKFVSYLWLWDESIVEVELSGDTYVRLSGMSQSEEFIDNLRKVIRPHLLPAKRQGHVFAIVYQSGRLALNSIGNAGIPLVRRNYTPAVMESFDFVIKDLNSAHPSGRIVILEGEPGTGKTHMVRALLLDVPDAMFVLVSPDMVTALGGPELLPLLLSHKHSYATGPIILILEDADRCLVTRQGDNINSIQSLLNLGDGILGSMLDLRIIATTNAKKLELEPAILRPGRLSKRLEVGALDTETAIGIVKALLPDNETALKDKRLFANKVTLAEAYSVARSHGWTPVARKEEEEEPDDDDDFYDEDDDD